MKPALHFPRQHASPQPHSPPPASCSKRSMDVRAPQAHPLPTRVVTPKTNSHSFALRYSNGVLRLSLGEASYSHDSRCPCTTNPEIRCAIYRLVEIPSRGHHLRLVFVERPAS